MLLSREPGSMASLRWTMIKTPLDPTSYDRGIRQLEYQWHDKNVLASDYSLTSFTIRVCGTVLWAVNARPLA
jgi:hypothetical protein